MRDLRGRELVPPPWGLVVEQDCASNVEAVTLAIGGDEKRPVRFRCAVRRSWAKRCRLPLRLLEGHTEDVCPRRVHEKNAGVDLPNGLEESRHGGDADFNHFQRVIPRARYERR